MTKKLSDLKRKNGFYEYSRKVLFTHGVDSIQADFKAHSIPEIINDAVSHYNYLRKSLPFVDCVQVELLNQVNIITIKVTGVD